MSVSSFIHAAGPVPGVVPTVQSWSPEEGTIDVGWPLMELAPAGAAQLQETAKVIAEDLAAVCAGREKSKVKVVLEIKAVEGSSPEAYSLHIGERIVIRGASPAGVYYGSRTLLQMLGKSPVLPKGRVVDHPVYKGRMLMLDVGRKPYPLPVLKDFIRMMGWYKMNELHLHLSDEAFGGKYAAFRVESKVFPGLASKDLHYTKQDLRELQDFARARGITITPEIDMPGHARCFTNYWPDITLKGYPNYIDVTNPRTIALMKQLLDEMIPLFDAPDFHIGTDEYRVGGPRKEELHEAFRVFINTMNTHIRSRGKNCRIWSGFEHMGGTTRIDPTVIIDMWETDDAKGQIAKGHSIINSNHGRTYIVPGCHYYGINRAAIYGNWEPWMVSGDMAKNPAKDDPKLLGGKLHVWFDQGPTGYTLTETAETTLTGVHSFAEKLWGHKGEASYQEFVARATGTLPIPNVSVFDRLPAKDGVVLDHPGEITLKDESASVPLPRADAARADLEYPWTLTMEVKRTADTKGRGVLLSSSMAEICVNYSRDEVRKRKGADGKEIKEKITKRGIGTLRAAGYLEQGAAPVKSFKVGDVSQSSDVLLPLNQWATLTVVGMPGRNSIWLDGVKIAESNNQMVCPLRRIGTRDGESFVGKIRKLRVVNRTLSAKEIGRAAGLDIPDNLAAACMVTASASDAAHGLHPANVTDEDPRSRWSSGPTRDKQWLALDLGKDVAFNSVDVTWETAVPKIYQLEVSTDAKTWKKVYVGEAKPGKIRASLSAQKARYLRVHMSQPKTQWGYSIHEIEVTLRRKK